MGPSTSEKTKDPTSAVTAVLIALAVILLTNPIKDWYQGRSFFTGRPAVSAILGFAFILLAIVLQIPWLPRIPIQRFYSWLSPLVASPWAWLLIIIAFSAELSIPTYMSDKKRPRIQVSAPLAIPTIAAPRSVVANPNVTTKVEIGSLRTENTILEQKYSDCSGAYSRLVRRIKETDTRSNNEVNVNKVDALMRAKFQLIDIQRKLQDNPHDPSLLNAETGANFELESRERYFDMEFRAVCQ